LVVRYFQNVNVGGINIAYNNSAAIVIFIKMHIAIKTVVT